MQSYKKLERERDGVGEIDREGEEGKKKQSTALGKNDEALRAYHANLLSAKMAPFVPRRMEKLHGLGP